MMTREELTARLAECEGHTPGEWTVPHFADSRTECDCDRVFGGPDCYSVAGVGHRTVNDKYDKYTFPPDAEAIANARLVALAPALASALRDAWEEIDRMKLSWDSAEAQIDDVDDELRDVVKENAALRKKLHEAGINPSLDEALNSGDGREKG